MRAFRLLSAGAMFSALLVASCSIPASAQAAPAPRPVRDGSHDFDFLYGKWRMPNHRLVKRLAGSHEWADFVSCDEAMPLPGGIGDMDVFRANQWPHFVGVTVRTYDPQTGLWRLYWRSLQAHGAADVNRLRPGRLDTIVYRRSLLFRS